ncbi:hypothetical protein SETIT_9G052600v2 [Setaria italica]|uniref:Uncharacterized protein n=2 Tax=Setaria TaxID=4554 RepID=K4AL74_SETIT|nr:uncharacterized protein LOC101753673 [Setaria italica]XP_034575614.1 uncharacterized protein LOC117839401 [Setaria viridis]RCV40427.1 hypothetical protein SETIT_9G052600v2 [Setaria italica]TKV90786.1 hypothetical protein SEVIR_9G051700v2 [Setaria viridis]
MGRKSAPIGSRYGRVCEELLEMGARVAVRSYGHCPQTGRMYYKPPSTPATGTADGSRNGEESASREAGASAAAARRQQQQAAAKVEFHASEFILYGGGKEEPRHCSR